jgi:N6-adenosine-specific RNA methylase IME4
MTYNPFEDQFLKNIGEPKVCFLLTKITVDVCLQVRLTQNEETIERYKQKYLDGVDMPPVILFDDDKTLWLADGFLRFEAAKRAGLLALPVEVHRGSRSDALKYACGANDHHGLPMTRADKHKAVKSMLLDPELSKLLDGEVAEVCKVSRDFVVRCKGELKEAGYLAINYKMVERNGKNYRMATANIGKSKGASSAETPIQATEEAAQGASEAPPQPEKQELSDEAYKQRTEDNRASRVAEIAKGAKAAQGGGKPGPFAVLLVDPPWEYEAHASKERDIENQYPTMTMRDLRRLDVPSISTKQAILYLWVTSPMIPDALSLVEGWGFRYRTCAVWDKEIAGMGYWFRQQHELLFVATRGNFPLPKPDARISSIFRIRRGAHSKKPIEVRAALESWYPDLPKVELFAREKAEGWTSIGNEIDGKDILEVIGLRAL